MRKQRPDTTPTARPNTIDLATIQFARLLVCRDRDEFAAAAEARHQLESLGILVRFRPTDRRQKGATRAG